MIQFLLNDTPIEVEKCSPSLTILDWLRTNKGKVGSKEGCATGDCGACTVLVGEEIVNPQGVHSWHYKTMNSCLLLLGNAHAKHIVTVEGVTPSLYPTLNELHPVQRALVECHGSQCGFCTPGIIMSLLALYINNPTYPGKSAVIHALGGNLCRCTGYSPILLAAEQAYSYPRSSENYSALATQFKASISCEQNQVPFLTNEQRTFYLPQTAAQLVALKSSHLNAHLVTGGTDFAIELSQNLLLPDTIISLSQTHELMQLKDNEGELNIGASLPYSQFVSQFCHYYPEAKELFERLGSTQVRNGGSLGGSLGNASPIGDPAPLLIALNATMDLLSARGTRTINVADFFLDYRKTVLKEDEVISNITIPKRSKSLKLACHKISKRFEDDISTVCLVLAIEHNDNTITHARCAMGGMAATPKNAPHIEQQLVGLPLSVASFKEAAKHVNSDFSPMSDVRASAEYRINVTKNLLHRVGIEFCHSELKNPDNLIAITRISHASL
ncbi:xanthine dehydrogenase small subunit [Pseudoalteromonas sp. MMG010]|uniref:xanthine dehydrogenase small subunit n=1 Tax=Pseudoalteromonas sp. MMG010 TaxID=2822685 RepID=UPI001B3A00A2|nr:xanthine dehydrogenase small subunit [Pseudoalteromonas sp. MMG010]MBQ4832922.1 xanthine dehydrogenase small subunit [Pseudoalteromonas sp. MMG010]